MPGSIQTIARAAAVLRLLGGAGRPLGLRELAAMLDLPAPTAHGIVRTLCTVGFVDQDRDTARYVLGTGLRSLDRGGWNPHELRSRAMNWADSLAGSSGMEVLLGVPEGSRVRLVHHVFRPDASPQRIRTGQELPLHATAMGKCLLAFAPVAVPPPRELALYPFTGRTCTTVRGLEDHLVVARGRGWATDTGEYRLGLGGIAAPLHATGGLVIGALGIEGPVEKLFGASGVPRPRMADQLMAVTSEISVLLRSP